MKKIDNNSTKNVLFRKLIYFCKYNKKIAILFLLGIIILLVIVSTATVNIVKYYNEKKRAEQMEEVSYAVKQVGSNLVCKTVITFANPEGIKQITLPEPDSRIINVNGKRIFAIDYEMQENHSYDFDVVYKNGSSKTLTVDFKIPRIEANYLEKNGLYLNAPDVSEFEEYNTRYMYMNEDEKLVPGNWISDDEPENWYDYSDRKWANILVENEGVETYFVWVPRYCYKVDKTTQRTEILFINMDNEFINKQTGETVDWDELEEQGYVIPEAFTWYSEKDGYTYLPGYWISKYRLVEKNSMKLDWSYITDVGTITVNITNTIADESIKFLYSIDGEAKPLTNNATFTFTGVTGGKKHINVTALNADGTIYASMTKSVEIVEPNPPELDGFDKDTTFYVYYDSENNPHSEIPISQDPPSNWYNYSLKRWANIVTKNNDTETYWVWIPRYEYYINPDIAAVQAPNQRVTTKFLNGTDGAEQGYAVPEAFTFNGEELTGYWITKYRLVEK